MNRDEFLGIAEKVLAAMKLKHRATEDDVDWLDAFTERFIEVATDEGYDLVGPDEDDEDDEDETDVPPLEGGF